MMDLVVSTVSAGLQNGDQNSHTGRAERVGYQTSPHAPNTPENNVCKPVGYRGSEVASFAVNGRQLICLPQAFEFFLKHLVGGLHTVYTKLKRLEITPVVCNVEQVRILRGVAAIQPGVNRCKLISPQEFDVLYDDCTSSSARPGRPPKRSNFFQATDMLDISPNKQLRRSLGDPSMFPFEGMKHMAGIAGTAGTTNNLLPSPTGAYPPLPIHGMPFVSPYQINLMHQAAVQMALANQLQSNLSKSKEPVVPIAMPPNHPIKSHQVDSPCHQTPVPTSQMVRSPPALVKSSQSTPFAQSNLFQDSVVRRIEPKPLLLAENNMNIKKADSLHSPASYYSEDLNVDDKEAPIERKDTYPQQHTIPTPPPSSPREPESHTSNTHSEHLRRSSINEMRRSTSPASKRNISPTEEHCRNLDDILLNIKSDIQSFMDSVVQHQEDIVADIEILRSKLKMETYNQQFIETLMREQQNTKALYQAQIEKDNYHKQQINNLLQLTKVDLGNQWFRKNHSPH